MGAESAAHILRALLTVLCFLMLGFRLRRPVPAPAPALADRQPERLRAGLEKARSRRRTSYAPSPHSWVPMSPAPGDPAAGEVCGACGRSAGSTNQNVSHCSLCGEIAHSSCCHKLALDCKRSALKPDAVRSTNRSSMKLSGPIMEHHWVRYRNSSLALGAAGSPICSLCATSHDEPTSAVHVWWECLWCHSLAHSTCLTHLLSGKADTANRCSLGQYASFVITPNELVNKGEQSNWAISRVLTSARAFALSRGGYWLGPRRSASERRLSSLDDSKQVNISTAWQRMDGEAATSSTEHPVIALVNYASLSSTDVNIVSELRKVLNPIQVWQLQPHEVEPAYALDALRVIPKLRTFCCGGDGTAAWCAHAASERGRPFAVLPLGTGNDLARVLGWEPVKLQNRDDSLSVTEALRKFVHDITDAREGYLDRWKLDLQSTSELKHCDDVQDAHAHDSEDENPNGYMLNYFSVGVDAKVTLGFHRLRQERPSLFKSRWLNKLMYTRFGAPEALLHTCYHLPSSVSLEVDGCQVRIPAQCEGLLVMSIASYMGGVRPWEGEDDDRWGPQAMDDGLLEVVSIRGTLHLGQLQVGLGNGAVKLAQGARVVITTSTDLPMQTDGEPWQQGPCTITMERHDQVKVLHRQSSGAKTQAELRRSRSRSASALPPLYDPLAD